MGKCKMRSILKLLPLLAIFGSGTVMADDKQGMFLGIGGGLMATSDADDNPLNLSLNLGYNFSESFAIEGQYTTSVVDGEVKTFFGNVEFDIETVAIYGVYRTPGPNYFKIKVGVINEEVSASAFSVSESGSDSGASVGIGGGFEISESSVIELEYTLIEEDVGFFSVGFVHNF